MQLADREEFYPLLEKLCAGFNVPCTEAREEAYWSGLAKMSIAQFARAVEAALSEDGPAKLPPPPALWALLKRARAAHTEIVQPKDERDTLEEFANRLLKIHAFNRGGLGSTGRFVPGYGLVDCQPSPELLAARIAKDKLVAEFCAYILEGEELATPQEFVRRWTIALEHTGLVPEKTLEQYRVMVTSADAKKPFPDSMARETKPKQTFIPLVRFG